jgi:exopolysaccharide biosynthesis polyprenyl glycosylphosphotransferase
MFKNTHNQFSFKVNILLMDLLIIITTVYTLLWLNKHELPNIFMFNSLYLFSAVIISSHYLSGNYDFQKSKSRLTTLIDTSLAFLLSAAIIVFVNYVFQKERSGIFGRGILINTLLISLSFSFVLRLIISKFLHQNELKSKWSFVLDLALTSAQEKTVSDLNLKGYFSFTDYKSIQNEASKYDSHNIIFLAKQTNLNTTQLRDLINRRKNGLFVTDIVTFFEFYFKKIPVDFIDIDWFLGLSKLSLVESSWTPRVKRLFDIFLSLLILVLTSPILLFTMLIIKLQDGGPIFYSQIRGGLLGKNFNIYKLRSMRINAESEGAQWAKKNDDRVTFIGNLIRKTRIDEIPQLVNILKGEMSFVGPRPERPEFEIMLTEQIPFYQMRSLVKPGLTGWAQIMYPYGSSIEDSKKKLEFDLYYIKNFSLLLELQIVVKTVTAVFLAKGR